MSEKRAYFTPSPSIAPQLMARVLFADASDPPKITFQVVEKTDRKSTFPELSEVTLSPLYEVCANETGFSLTGRNSSTQIIGRLSIDTTVEPPLATYQEPISSI